MESSVKDKPLKTDNSHSELLVLPDGNILAHNITPALASVLSELNPADEPMRQRANRVRVENAAFNRSTPLPPSPIPNP
jgi:hypothetical protein